MKKLITALVLSIASLYAGRNDWPEYSFCEPDIYSSFSYTTIGVGPLPLPMLNLGVGRRCTIGDSGAIDLNASISTIVLFNFAQGSASRLWYFNQRSSSQSYCGLGATLGAGFTTFAPTGVLGYLSPTLTFGHEFFNSQGFKRFFQLETSFPSLILNEFNTVWILTATVKYGIAF